MSDIAAAAEALGIPESLVQRSAEARAAETGGSVDEIIAAWAGGGSAPAAQATSEPEPAETDEAADVEEVAEPETPEPETPEVTIEIPSAEPTEPASTGTTRAEVPAEVNAAEAANLPVVITVPTVGIKERTNFTIPKWLAALFFLAPLLALFALGGSATGVCGEATELRTDVVTGNIVNCDGTAFEGSGVGGGGADFIALGDAIYNGSGVSGVNCSTCHGASGGGGAGPALNGVLTVFGACTDHVEWVSLGTGGFQAAGESTYGDTNKSVGGFGIMPGFSSSLTEEQVAAVSAFERVRFGGQSPDEALADCGLAESPEEGGVEGEEGTEDGSEPAGDDAGTEATTTTAPPADA